MKRATKALIAVADPHIYSRIERLLENTAAEAERAVDRDSALAVGSRRRFDLVLSDLPLRGPSGRELLARVAGGGSPSAGCPIVLYGHSPGVQHFDGAGEVSSCRTVLEFLRAAAHYLALGDRIAQRLLVQIEVEVDVESALVRRAVQTANLSASGMLLRTQRLLPVGALVPFALDLPADPEPVRGQAEVVRHADPATEGLFGMGLRFVELARNGGERLAAFVSSTRVPLTGAGV